MHYQDVHEMTHKNMLPKFHLAPYTQSSNFLIVFSSSKKKCVNARNKTQFMQLNKKKKISTVEKTYEKIRFYRK